MTAKKQPRVNAAPAAQNYAGPNERIIEVSTPKHGGLISFRTSDDGSLIVDLYRLDPGVKVFVEGQEYTKPNG